jgi:hypothetical protein
MSRLLCLRGQGQVLVLFSLLLFRGFIHPVLSFGPLVVPRRLLSRILMPLGSTNNPSKQNPALLQRDRQRNAFYIPTTISSNNNNQPLEVNNDISDSPMRSATNANQRVQYGMASVDLSSRWYELVRKEQVAVTTTVPVHDDSSGSEEFIGVNYGVRRHPIQPNCFMEFVEPALTDNSTATPTMHPKIATMNATLQQAAILLPEEVQTNASTSSSSLQYRYDGDFVAQLQLVRTLRPPPSPGFESSTSNDFHTCSTPPPYNVATDSFVTGPLRLELRPLVARLSLSCLRTDWDIYHNISPADVRGHFLLVPTLLETAHNNRGQALIEADCQDLVHLTASIRPLGSLMVGFNSVGAGASQNHIHCHVWPSPPIPLLLRPKREESNNIVEQEEAQEDEEEEFNEDDHDHDHDHSHAYDTDDNGTTANGWSCYAPSRVMSSYDFVDIYASGTSNYDDDDGDVNVEALVEVSYLHYPCFCVQLSTGATTTPAKTVESLHALGKALWTVLGCIGNAPHNVCMLNRPSPDHNNNNDHKDDGCVNIDVYVFVRSRERSPTIVPASKAGASEMMGVFHCHNLQQLDELVGSKPSPMARVLEDVSHENPKEMWSTIKEELSSMSLP